MPIYRAGKCRWRVRIWWKGVRQDWIINGQKSDAEAFEARKRVEIEGAGDVEQRVAPTFSAFCVDTYKPFAKTHLRPGTWSVRRYHLAALIQHLGTMKLTSIGPREIEAYKQERLTAGIKPISVNNELAVLQAVLSYARHLRVPTAQFAVKRLPVRQKSRLLVWSDENVEALLSECMMRSKHIIPLVVFLANTGTRRGEALALLWADVDLDARMVRITPSEEWQPKNGRAREIPLSDELHAVLSSMPRRGEHVFTTTEGHAYASWPKRQFDRARKAAGLQGGPHTLRHYAASRIMPTRQCWSTSPPSVVRERESA